MGKRIDKQEIDLLIVGAGPVGCTIAERAAQVKGWKSLIIDKREHIAGRSISSNIPNNNLDKIIRAPVLPAETKPEEILLFFT